MKTTSWKRQFRDEKGRWTDAITVVKLYEENVITEIRYANGRKYRGSIQQFTIDVHQADEAKKLRQSQQRRYDRVKIERRTKHKIQPTIYKEPVIEVGPRGGAKEVKRKGSIYSYVRWSYQASDRPGETPPGSSSGRNAITRRGTFSMKELLAYGGTSFFKVIDRLKREMILDPNIFLVSGGIHYYQYRPDEKGYKEIIAGTEKTITGTDILDVTRN